jgi:hypothetical protein
MNGKTILLFMLCLNFVAVIMGNACVSSQCTYVAEDSFFATFYKMDSLEDINAIGNPEMSSEFLTSTSDLTKQEAGGEVTTGGGLSLRSIVDGLRMIGAIISLITPGPIIIVLASLSVPIWAVLLLSIVLVVIYVMSLAEFVRGATF